ncbi:MAG: nuclear transport factor 2 family protein [Proteobacteria bacterium]|nr:nuclear transport factor 2 family protein [Pseudomonadota bacterium]HQR02902.1 limonene-1,2-epoxide hydrolase family protein [Rhodocyclaceae bacterium]
MSNPEHIVNTMMAACCRKDFEAVLACFHEDACYHNIPIEPVTGHAGIRAMLEPFISAATEVDWVIHNSVSNGQNLVMNERTDRFLLPTGWIELPVMGVFEVREGKIAGWRDYFDMGPMRPLLGG